MSICLNKSSWGYRKLSERYGDFITEYLIRSLPGPLDINVDNFNINKIFDILGTTKGKDIVAKGVKAALAKPESIVYKEGKLLNLLYDADIIMTTNPTLVYVGNRSYITYPLSGNPREVGLKKYKKNYDLLKDAISVNNVYKIRVNNVPVSRQFPVFLYRDLLSQTDDVEKLINSEDDNMLLYGPDEDIIQKADFGIIADFKKEQILFKYYEQINKISTNIKKENKKENPNQSLLNKYNSQREKLRLNIDDINEEIDNIKQENTLTAAINGIKKDFEIAQNIVREYQSDPTAFFDNLAIDKFILLGDILQFYYPGLHPRVEINQALFPKVYRDTTPGFTNPVYLDYLQQIEVAKNIINNTYPDMLKDIMTIFIEKQFGDKGNNITEILKTISKLYRIHGREEGLYKMKDINWGETNFLDITEYGNYIMDLVYRVTSEQNAKANIEMSSFEIELEILIENLENSYEWKHYLKTYKKQYKKLEQGIFTPFLQRNNSGQITPYLEDKFSSLFYETRSSMRPTENDFKNNTGRLKLWNQWKQNNLILLDARKLLNNYYMLINPTTTFSQQEIDEHIDEIKEALGEEGYDEMLQKVEEAYDLYINDRNVKLADIIIKYSGDYALIQAEMDAWDAEYSPFEAAERFYENPNKLVTISGKNIRYTKWRYTRNIPKKYFNTGKETGYYSNNYIKIQEIDEAKEMFEFFKEKIAEYLSIYPDAYTSGFQSNFLPLFENNILGDLFLMGKYSEIASKLFSKVVDHTFYIEKSRNSLNKSKDILNRDKFNVKPVGINKNTPIPLLNIPEIIKAFAYGSMVYRNTLNIKNELNTISLYLNTIKKPDVDITPSNLIEAYNTYKQNIFGNRRDDIKTLHTGKRSKYDVTTMSWVDFGLSYFYHMAIGWNIKAAAVQFSAGIIYNLNWAAGGDLKGKGINLKDLTRGYGYMMSNAIKGALDVIPALSGTIDNISQRVFNNHLMFKKNYHILKRYGILDLIPMHVSDATSIQNRFDSKNIITKTFEEWWENTLSPSALMRRGDFLNQGAMIMAFLTKKENEITVVSLNGSTTKKITPYSALDHNGRIKDEIYIGGELYYIEELEKLKVENTMERATQTIKKAHGNYRQDKYPIAAKKDIKKLLTTLRSWLPQSIKDAHLMTDDVNGRYMDSFDAYEKGKMDTLIETIKGISKRDMSNIKEADIVNLKRMAMGAVNIGLVYLALQALLAYYVNDDDDDADVAIFAANMLKRVNVETLFSVDPRKTIEITRSVVPLLSFIAGIMDFSVLIVEAFASEENKTYYIKGKGQVSKSEYIKHKAVRKFLPVASQYYRLEKDLKKFQEYKPGH